MNCPALPSGFQANLAAVLALADRHTPVICDRLIHHSLLVGVKASGAKLFRFKHNNLAELETVLRKAKQSNPQKRPLVITESLFSMEGTTAPIKEIAKLCIEYNSKLLIDEAHAFGVMGSEGRGESFGLKEPYQLSVGPSVKHLEVGGISSNRQDNRRKFNTKLWSISLYNCFSSSTLCKCFSCIKSN